MKTVQWKPGSIRRTNGQARRQTYDEANSHFSQFCERPEKLCVLPTPCTGVFAWIQNNKTVNCFYNRDGVFNPLTPELKPSAQRCLTRFFTGDFAS
jgi:hypothetical protein